MSTEKVNPYLRDAVQTASPEQLQLMLYDGAIRFATQGKKAILAGDHEQTYDRLSRAQNIMMEMLNGLRYDVNEELCKRVASVYMFIYNKLVDASVNREAKDVDDAVRILTMERDTWRLVVDKVAQVRESERSSVESTAQPGGEPAQPGERFCVDG